MEAEHAVWFKKQGNPRSEGFGSGVMDNVVIVEFIRWKASKSFVMVGPVQLSRTGGVGCHLEHFRKSKQSTGGCHP